MSPSPITRVSSRPVMPTNNRQRNPKMDAKFELMRDVASKVEGPAQQAREFQRRIAFMERIIYWSRKPHEYRTHLDPVGTFCDLCWAPADAVQHLLHPIAAPRPA